jgi:hypothetical protein
MKWLLSSFRKFVDALLRRKHPAKPDPEQITPPENIYPLY